MTVRSITREPPPSELDDNTSAWLNRVILDISVALGQSQDLEVLYIVPEKPFVGMLRYFGGAIDANITSEGVWIYTSSGWVKL